MTETPDAVVIGGGHNGLACACYLAMAGLDVLVVEEYRLVGGMTITEELAAPGFRSDVHASGYQLANISPAPGELDLESHGVELIEPGYAWAHAFPDGGCIAVSGDLDDVWANIARYSLNDADTTIELFRRYRSEREQIIRSLFSPPSPLSEALREMERTPKGMERYRMSLQSMRSWGDEAFETEEAKCLFGAFAPFVGHGPDDASGAEIAWLFASVLQAEGNKLVRGGMHKVSLALAAKLKDLGGRIRTGASAKRIEVAGTRATAVWLADGERIETGLAASSVDPAQLALRLLGTEVIGDDAASRMRRLEWGDPVFVIYAALDGPVEYASGSEPGSAAHVHLSPPSLGSMATATNQCRAGLLPEDPVIVSWNDSAKRRIIGRAVYSPIDLARKLSSAVRGTIPHGAMVPYQAGPLRPTPDFAAYRSPVENVYLCGSGSHPGAGVSMAAGRNAASLILGDLGLGHDLDLVLR
jgi:phytoene dehydrogenase-like protein